MSAKKRILVVEDEPDLRQLLSIRLEINGFETIGAEDGEAALALVRSEKPDLVLLDLMIPKISGFEVCRMIKFDDELKKIPVIVLSAMTQDRDKQAVMEAGADAYFVKNFDLQVIIDKIKECTA